MTETIKLERLTTNGATAQFNRIREVYAEVYAEPPYEKNEDDIAEFRRRFDIQVALPGFILVAALTEKELVGFAYGHTFRADAWWRGTIEEPPPQIRSASKFAVIELVLRKPWRGRGLGRQLMDELLRDRHEEYAMLLSNPRAPARGVYDKWGWRQVGTVQSYPHWPQSHALVLPLQRQSL